MKIRAELLLALAMNATVIEAQQQPDPATVPIVLTAPGMSAVKVEQGIEFARPSSGPLVLDLYRPANSATTPLLPAVVFISGTDDARSWMWYQSYGRLTAAKGMIGIVPNKRYPRGFGGMQTGYTDTDSVLTWLRANGPRLGIDPDRICVWAFSGGGRLMSVALSEAHSRTRCVVGFYPLADATGEFAVVADTVQRATLLARYSPAHVLRGRGSKAPPVFIARAGRDGAVINESIDRFLLAATAANADVTFVNYPDGLHGFDAYNDTDESRRIIERAYAFIAIHTARDTVRRQ